MQKIKCCQDCEERYAGCHSKCKRYLEERRKLDIVNERKRKDKYLDDYESYHRRKRR